MISPNTKPGTEVVCVDDDTHAYRIPGVFYDETGLLGGLRKGEIYSVEKIEIEYAAKSGFAVKLAGISRGYGDRGYDIARFRYLDLSGLDRLLAIQEPLGPEFQKVLNDNLWELMDSES